MENLSLRQRENKIEFQDIEQRKHTLRKNKKKEKREPNFKTKSKENLKLRQQIIDTLSQNK